MIQNTSGPLDIKLLLLQDALEVIHTLILVFHVSRQVAIEEADAVAKHGHSGTNAAFIPLQNGHSESF